MHTFPRSRDLSSLFLDEAKCLEYLREQGAFDLPSQCPVCYGRIVLHGHFWKCSRKSCRKQESYLKTSFFGQSRMPVNDILELGYYWLAQCRYESILKITNHSPNTVTDYMKHFRDLAAASLDTDDTLVGGDGILVEIDESKFGKRKYNRGHRVEGAWVIGGVEATEERKMFVEVVERRDQEAITEVLSRHVLPGSVIVTDCWRGYLGIDEALSVHHLTVNHSETFVDPHTGACTNHIEGTWGAIKARISPRNRTKAFIEGHLLEFIWRRKHSDDLWGGLLSCFRNVGY
jgi:transposase-like protein